MPRYAQGQPVQVSTEVRDSSNVLVAPGSILLRVRRPDGTFLPDYTTPTPDAVGKYHQDLPSTDLAQLGHYQYAWITTGVAAGVSPPAGFDVVDPFTPAVLTLADAKSALGKTRSTDDEELQLFVDAVNRWVDEELGPVVARPVTEVVTATPRGALLLRGPVLAVTAATRSGAAVSVTGWTARVGDIVTGPTWLSGTYAVTYLAGYASVPADLQLALRELVQHWWDTQRAASPAPSAGGLDDGGGFDPRLGFAVPNRVEEKLAHYRRPVIA